MVVRWIKLVTDIFDDEKMRLIGSEKDGDTLQLIWIRLLCLAGRCNSGGLLTLTDDMPLSDKMLAVLFGKPLSVVRRALRLFERYGMITQDGGALAVTNWGKHQSLDKPEKDKESARQRTAACRARKRQRGSGEAVTEDEESCNADVTLPERYTSVTVKDCNTYRNRIRIRDKEEDKKERHKEKDAVYDSPGPPEGDVTVDDQNDSTEDGARETKTRRQVKPKADDALFNAFWNAYPKKMSRMKARESFDRLNPDGDLTRQMIDAVNRWKVTDQWQKNGGQFVPYPATWLNQRRWEDEPPEDEISAEERHRRWRNEMYDDDWG